MKFEIPYNFDPNYCTIMDSFLNPLECVSCIFLQALDYDSTSTPRYEETYAIPTNDEEYAAHVGRLKELGKPLYVLLQFPKIPQIYERLDFYKEIGIDGVITAHDKLAIEAKKKGFYTVCSIVKSLNFEDFFTKDLSMYDEICLYHSFCRGLDAVKLLPKKYKYQILVNNHACVYNCPNCINHWLGKEKSCYSVASTVEEFSLYTCGFTYLDLKHYAPYINTFKLQGREHTTEYILMTLLELSGKITTPGDSIKTHDDAWRNSAVTDGIIKITQPKRKEHKYGFSSIRKWRKLLQSFVQTH
jgi:hypothetical protein